MGGLPTAARAGASLLALLLAASADSRSGAAQAADASTTPKACAAMAGLKLDGGKVVIDKASLVPASAPGTLKPSPSAPAIGVAIPAYCLVEGMADARTGVDGVAYGLGFQIALPRNWNGRFLFQGGGGTNGVIRPPLGVQAAGEVPALARGFAVISTDGGHKATQPGFDSSFRKDQQAVVDFAYNSVARVTHVGKDLVAAYYGRKPDRSYFVGCSTGGREAMLAAQRNPLEYDGVVSGAPAMRTSYSNLALTNARVAFNNVAPKDPTTGKPIIAQAFSADEKKTFMTGLLAACDGADGLKDGLITNTRACKFDPAALQCAPGKTTDCLSAAKITALKTAFAGPKNREGRQIYSPYPYDTGVTTEKDGSISGFIPGRIPAMQGATDDLTIDIDARDAAAQFNAEHGAGETYHWTNLTTFFGHGGKIVFYHGMSDPWFSALDTLDYYERLQKDGGDQAQAASALYLAPGMGHCQGGEAFDRFDLLSQVVDWAEHGKAPTPAVAAGAAFPGHSRPICPYPAYPHYRGEGDPKSAASFQCRI